MKLFFERLFSSIKNELSILLIAIVFAIPLIIIGTILVFLIIGLPIIFLQTYIGDWSALWGLIVFIALLIWCHFDSIKKWFHWQFIEPFQK